MSKTNTAKQISEVLGAQGLHTIGALVFWTLSGVRIARDTLAEALEAIGLGAAMVRKPTPHAALATAIKRVGMGRKGILFRQVKREWALVFERGGGKRLLLAHDATFRVNAEGAIEVECMHDGEIPELHNLRLAIEAQYQEVLGYVSSADLSAVLCTAMQGVGSETMLGGLSLRQSAGGLYYVRARGERGSAAKLDRGAHAHGRRGKPGSGGAQRARQHHNAAEASARGDRRVSGALAEGQPERAGRLDRGAC